MVKLSQLFQLSHLSRPSKPSDASALKARDSSASQLDSVVNEWRALNVRFGQHKRGLFFCLLVSVLVWAFSYPQSFWDMWLTRDQQAQWLFNQGQYEKAAGRFQSVQWQAYSYYGAEKFDQSALLYGQYTDEHNRLAKANALAHGSHYIKARNLYQRLLQENPNNKDAGHNLALVQKLIDDINRMSESQVPEGPSKELGDEPQQADGADKQEARVQDVEQLKADQLLLDPDLNAMWLRGVQKDPARFLAQKFTLQLHTDVSDSTDREDSSLETEVAP